MQQAPSATAARGALAGARVIELASVVMGPLAGQILGDLGADVIKVETDALSPATLRRHCPHVGEQTAEILAEIGLPAVKSDDLVGPEVTTIN